MIKIGGIIAMAKCEICSKGLVFGNNVSHSHRRSNRTWSPNIRKIRIDDNGTARTMYVCTRCLRTSKKNGTIKRAVKAAKVEEAVAAE